MGPKLFNERRPRRSGENFCQRYGPPVLPLRSSREDHRLTTTGASINTLVVPLRIQQSANISQLIMFPAVFPDATVLSVVTTMCETGHKHCDQ